MSNPRILIRQRPSSASIVSSINYSNYQNGPVPHGANTAYFTPVGTVAYESVAAKLFKAPNMTDNRDIAIDVPKNGLWVQTIEDKLMELKVSQSIAASVRTPQYRLDRLANAISELDSVPDKTFAFMVLKVVNGVGYLYTQNRALAKCFDVAPALSAAEIQAIGTVATASGSNDYVAGLSGFIIAAKQIPAEMIDFMASFAPAIAAAPYWTMHASGTLADDVDVTGVLELHLRVVAKLKRLGATMSTRSLSNVLVDAVIAIDSDVQPIHVHTAADWFSGRYPYSGTPQNLALVEGIHPHLIGQVYPDMSFDGSNIKKGGQPIASVVGANTWPSSQQDFNRISRAADILSQVLVGITALLADDSNVVNPSLLGQCGVGFISDKLAYSMR